MKPSVTTIIIIGAAVLVVTLGVLVRYQTAGNFEPAVPRPASQEHAAPRTSDAARPGNTGRSARVQERLNELRAAYKERRGAQTNEPNSAPPAGAVPAAPKLAAAAPFSVPASGSAVPAAAPPAPPAAPAAAGAPGGPIAEEEEEEVAALTHTLLNDPDPEERISAVFFLSTVDGRLAVPALLQGMRDAEPEVRLAVVEGLGDYSEELAPKMLEPALTDPDPEVRFEAVGLLGEMENGEAIDLVRKSLQDKDEEVRSLAEGILDVTTAQ